MVVACAGDRDPPAIGEPTFYRSMASAGAQVDAGAAASMISGYRKNNGLGAVAVDPALMKLAAEHAKVMASRDKLDHHVGRSFSQRVAGSGYDAKAAYENIGAGYHTLAEAFSGWRGSPGHRTNMLQRNVTHIGIATAYAPRSKYKVFWALVLASPDDRKR
ncbi:MAG: CAP domain-containing protein [Rhizobiales bacterium]|nr:CAP domain-containing protein [Hyphomicrobiales bacterium]